MSFCSRCGSELDYDARFCNKCGTPVERIEVAPTGCGAPQPSRHPKTALIAIVSAVSAVALVVVAFYISKAFLPSFFGMTFVNSAAFPDDAMRDAVSEQLDVDGDGILWSSETEWVHSITVEPENIVFSDSASEADTPKRCPSDKPGSVKSLNCVRYFPNLVSLSCSGSYIDEVDISSNKDLSYVDLCGTGITQLDVSNNKVLTSLYCDEGVTITGTEAAGLYWRDLITSASYQPADSSEAITIDIAYDSLGRPLKLSDDNGILRLYEYCDYGVETCRVSNNEYMTCAYDEQGRIASVSITKDGSSDEGVYFRYGEDGLLASFEKSGWSGEYYKSMSSLSYENGLLTEQNVDFTSDSMRFKRDMNTTWSFDGSGKMISSTKSSVCADISRSGDYVQEINRTFNEDGLCTSSVCETNQVAGKQGVDRVDVAYESGIAVSAACTSDGYGMAEHAGTQKLEMNADGYVSSVTFDDPGTARDGGKLSVSYVKRIAPLSERAYASGVPVFQIETNSNMASLESVVQNWITSSDEQLGWLTLIEHDPWSDPLYYYGVNDNAVNVANEEAIVAYDASLRAGKNQAYEAEQASAPTSEQVTDTEKEYLEFMALSYYCAMGLGDYIGDGAVADQPAGNLAQLISEICNPGLSAGYLRDSQYIDKDSFEFEGANNHSANIEISESDGLKIVSSYCGKDNTPDASDLQQMPVSFDGTNFIIDALGAAGGSEIDSWNMSRSGETYTFECRIYRTGSNFETIDESPNYQVEAVVDPDSMFGFHLVSMKPLG